MTSARQIKTTQSQQSGQPGLCLANATLRVRRVPPGQEHIVRLARHVLHGIPRLKLPYGANGATKAYSKRVQVLVELRRHNGYQVYIKRAIILFFIL